MHADYTCMRACGDKPSLRSRAALTCYICHAATSTRFCAVLQTRTLLLPPCTHRGTRDHSIPKPPRIRSTPSALPSPLSSSFTSVLALPTSLSTTSLQYPKLPRACM